jgi:predicted CXXCH cytochrome family protein
MRGRFQHYEHVLRVAGLLATGLVVFIIVRGALVPSDFGVYGFYRAGTLEDIKAQTPAFAGHDACEPCHTPVFDLRKTARHANLNCEACHGPAAKHAENPLEVKPKTLDGRTLCLTCHTKLPGKPAFMPQIVPADHAGDAECTACHQPHHPKIQK